MISLATASPNLALDMSDTQDIIVRLLKYWQDVRGARPMPEENEIDPEALGEDWEYCFLLQSRDVYNVNDYNFTYLGSKILAAYVDKSLDENNEFMVGPNAFRLSNHFQNVLTTRLPMIDEGEITTIHGYHIHFHQILLPLGNDAHVAAIFGGMRYKIVLQPTIR